MQLSRGGAIARLLRSGSPPPAPIAGKTHSVQYTTHPTVPF
jgi:hypothetical protein